MYGKFIVCYNYLNEISEQHPLTSWFIVAVLLSILIGLITDTIYDRYIVANESENRTVIECIENENTELILWDKSEKQGVKVTYKQGVYVREEISVEELEYLLAK